MPIAGTSECDTPLAHALLDEILVQKFVFNEFMFAFVFVLI